MSVIEMTARSRKRRSFDILNELKKIGVVIVITYILLLITIIIHELGHAIVALYLGADVLEIGINPFTISGYTLWVIDTSQIHIIPVVMLSGGVMAGLFLIAIHFVFGFDNIYLIISAMAEFSYGLVEMVFMNNMEYYILFEIAIIVSAWGIYLAVYEKLYMEDD